MPITWEKEQEIIAALEKDARASRVVRARRFELCDGVADRGPQRIALAAGRETMGAAAAGPTCGGIEARRANPDAPQSEIAS